MDKPSIPDGYTSFVDIMQRLFIHAPDWRIQDFSLLGALSCHPVDHGDPVAFFSALFHWQKDLAAERVVRQQLGYRLASQKSQSVGISDRSGDLDWIPAAAWRVTAPVSENSFGPVIDAAFQGHRLMISAAEGRPHGNYSPLLSLRELAVAFAAQNLPPEPDLQPVDAHLSEKPSHVNPKRSTDHEAAMILDQPGNAPKPEGAPIVTQVASWKSRGGRPPVHDWEAFWIEVACRADLDGLELENRPELRKHLLDWWHCRSDHPPEASTVDKKLAALYRSKASRQT